MVNSVGNPQDLSEFHSNLALRDSAPNPLLELHLSTDLASLDPTSHPAFLNQWPSTGSQDFYYQNYPASRFGADQDAWNPLLAAGVPRSSTGSHMPLPDADCAFPKPHYRTPSEAGSQYMGSLHSADSGYGSNSGAHSGVPSSYVDSLSSPQTGAKEHAFAEPMPFFDHSRMAGPGFAQHFNESLFDASVKCDHPACSWIGKCPSDKRYVHVVHLVRMHAHDISFLGNTRPVIESFSNAMSLTVLVKRALALLMIWPVTRNAFTTRNPSEDRR